MRIAIIHEWFVSMRGGEKVVELLADLYPDADIFVLHWVKGSVSAKIERHRITTSFLQKFPFIQKHYRHYLPFFPIAVESFNLNEYDLVISSNHCVAKGIIPAPNARHICYCHTPMRYIWNMYFDYFGKERNLLTGLIYKSVAHHLRIWDVSSAERVDSFIANSTNVANRIKRYYNKPSKIIYPPVDTEFYYPVSDKMLMEPYYLIVSALVPYKKIELAIEAFNQTGQRLVIIGEGPEKKNLVKKAKNNITFYGWATNEQLRMWYSHCKALIFPGEEDFGIIPVEAQACGSPVIAYARGGATETVIDRATGIFFHNQQKEDLMQAIITNETMHYDKTMIIAKAKRFSNKIFCDSFKAHVDHIMEKKQ